MKKFYISIKFEYFMQKQWASFEIIHTPKLSIIFSIVSKFIILKVYFDFIFFIHLIRRHIRVKHKSASKHRKWIFADPTHTSNVKHLQDYPLLTHFHALISSIRCIYIHEIAPIWHQLIYSYLLCAIEYYYTILSITNKMVRFWIHRAFYSVRKSMRKKM